LGFFVLGVVSLSSLLSVQADAQVVPPGHKAVDALQPIAWLSGDYTTSNTEFRAPAKDDDDRKSEGSIRCQVKARGHILTVEKNSPLPDGSVYDDLMVFQFDKSAGKLRATLFHPGAPGPRPIEVEVTKTSGLVLHYEPTKFGDQTIVTRETITRQDNGTVKWLVERQTDGGEFVKVRELIGKRKPSARE
jgi:hypothetical protein